MGYTPAANALFFILANDLSDPITGITAALLLSPFTSLTAQDQPAPSIELGAPFRDNAILQCEMPVPVWGWSKPGATVTVEFAGQKESAKADADGKWMLKLKPLTANAEPAEMVIQESGKKVVLKNKGDKLIVSLDFAEGGLLVGQAIEKDLLDAPAVLENSEDKVKMFYLAGEDRVWHPASMKIDGDKVVVSSPAVKAPRGVSYGAEGIGSQPNLYNKAMLPLIPFIYYDNTRTSERCGFPLRKQNDLGRGRSELRPRNVRTGQLLQSKVRRRRRAVLLHHPHRPGPRHHRFRL
jgi:hypothetical protein